MASLQTEKQAIFVEYNVDSRELNMDPAVSAYSLDEMALRRIIVTASSLWKKRFTAENLAGVFGYTSMIAKRAIKEAL